MTHKRSFSIVTPSFNQAAYIGESLESVQRQRWTDVEHWVIDGGSRDGTVEMLRSYSGRHDWSHLRWISETDRGQSHALNKGFAAASGEIIGWLNSDDRYLPGCFERVARISRKTRKPISFTVTIASSTRTAGYNASVARSNSAALCCSTTVCCISRLLLLFFAGEFLIRDIASTNAYISPSTPSSSCAWPEVAFASVISARCLPTFDFNPTAKPAVRQKSNSKKSAGSWKTILRFCDHYHGQ